MNLAKIACRREQRIAVELARLRSWRAYGAVALRNGRAHPALVHCWIVHAHIRLPSPQQSEMHHFVALLVQVVWLVLFVAIAALFGFVLLIALSLIAERMGSHTFGLYGVFHGAATLPWLAGTAVIFALLWSFVPRWSTKP